MALGRGVFEAVRPPLRARVPSDYLKLAPVQLDASIHPELDENLEPRPEGDDDRRESSKLSRRWLRPPLATMASLRGCAMVELVRAS